MFMKEQVPKNFLKKKKSQKFRSNENIQNYEATINYLLNKKNQTKLESKY